MVKPSDQNCGRGIFFGHRLFLGTNRKFQSRLTLSAYNSASKALNIKKYHIFGISRTPAFTWYPPRYMMRIVSFILFSSHYYDFLRTEGFREPTILQYCTLFWTRCDHAVAASAARSLVFLSAKYIVCFYI